MGTGDRARRELRRANPFVMLAVGILIGALLVAIGKSPSAGPNSAVSSVGGQGTSSGTGPESSSPAAAGGPAAGDATATPYSAPTTFSIHRRRGRYALRSPSKTKCLRW